MEGAVKIGANAGTWAALAGAALAVGAALVGVAHWRRRRIN
jgi:hypothetical protein